MSGKKRRPDEEVNTLKLRKLSREAYLEKRVARKVEELRKDLLDEHRLFDGVKLSFDEIREFNHKKEVYEIVSRPVTEDVSEYRIPDAYDVRGCVDQQKRFSVASHRCLEGGDREMNLQEVWQENQARKATVKFGSKDRKQSSDGYEFVFDDHIDNIRASLMEFDTVESNKCCRDSIDKSRLNTRLKKLQEERKSLPVHAYKDELLQVIKEHQIVIIVGETGSGKTTQIPQYLHEAGFTKFGKIGCTQPRRVAAMSVAARVAREMGVKLGHEVGYSIRFEDCTSDKTVVKYMTDGMLLREFLHEPDLASYSVIMIDEAHERTISTDILFGLVKDVARFRPDLKLLISSATLDADKFSDYFDCAPIYTIPGRRFPVEICYSKAPVSDYVDAAIVTALQIHVKEAAPGDILIFLTGQDEIETAEEMLKNRMKGFGTRIGELIICPIYANLPTDMQAKIFEPTPQGARKIVLATNIAETSLTIDGIQYVIDPGYVKMKTFSPKTGMESLLVVPISKASANQRAGRSGRTGPGKCFRLYTAHSYNNDLKDSTPEIQRTNLANVALSLTSLGIEELNNFDFMDQPPKEALIKALDLLYALGALNKFGQVTKTGMKLAEFPLDPMLSKMLVASEKYKCSEEIITIAAMLSVGNSIFYRPKNKQVLADAAMKRFHEGNVGDHIALLNVYNEWQSCSYGSSWCYENFVQVKSMKRARSIREQLQGILERLGIEITSNLNDIDAIKKAITAGFFPNAAMLQKDGSYRTVKQPQIVHIHPSSGLAKAEPLRRVVVYHELVQTSKEYMRQVIEIKPEWLIEIAPHYYPSQDVKDLSAVKKPRVLGRSVGA